MGGNAAGYFGAAVNGWRWRAGIITSALLALAGCGLRTAPQPLSAGIPPPQELRAWMRDTQVVVIWKSPPERLARAWDGLAAYRITRARLPLGCPDCPPLEAREDVVRLDSEEIAQHQERTVFRFTPGGPPATWSIRVSMDFRKGASPLSPPVLVDTTAGIPAGELHWERVEGAQGRSAIRLYWNARRERIVQIITPGGGREERDLMYRVNLYRRLPPQRWPPLPVNPQPVAGLFWLGPEPFASDGAEAVEYHMRLVDQQGNEGPPSDPVSIPAARGGSP